VKQLIGILLLFVSLAWSQTKIEGDWLENIYLGSLAWATVDENANRYLDINIRGGFKLSPEWGRLSVKFLPLFSSDGKHLFQALGAWDFGKVQWQLGPWVPTVTAVVSKPAPETPASHFLPSARQPSRGCLPGTNVVVSDLLVGYALQQGIYYYRSKPEYHAGLYHIEGDLKSGLFGHYSVDRWGAGIDYEGENMYFLPLRNQTH